MAEHQVRIPHGGARRRKAFHSVYAPKDVITDGRTYPIMMQRTGYNVAPYGPDLYRTSLGPSELFETPV
jgi:hypothetical protein